MIKPPKWLINLLVIGTAAIMIVSTSIFMIAGLPLNELAYIFLLYAVGAILLYAVYVLFKMLLIKSNVNKNSRPR